MNSSTIMGAFRERCHLLRRFRRQGAACMFRHFTTRVLLYSRMFVLRHLLDDYVRPYRSRSDHHRKSRTHRAGLPIRSRSRCCGQRQNCGAPHRIKRRVYSGHINFEDVFVGGLARLSTNVPIRRTGQRLRSFSRDHASRVNFCPRHHWIRGRRPNGMGSGTNGNYTCHPPYVSISESS